MTCSTAARRLATNDMGLACGSDLGIMNILERVRQRKGITESLSNIGWLSGDRFIRMFGAVVVGVLVARYLGPTRFGLLNYGMAIYGLFNIISNLGLDSLIVRDIALDENGEPRILGTAFVLKAAASVVTTIAAIIAAWLLDPHDKVLIIIVALLSFASISQALDVIDYFFQAQVRSRYTVVPRTIAFVAASLARLAAVFLHADLMVFAWIAALEILAGEIGLGISYIRFRRLVPRWNWHLDHAKTLLTESWPLLISSVMVMVYLRTDQILLGKLGSMAAVGNYTAATRLSEVWYAIPVIVASSVMPRLLKSRDQHPERYYARLQTFYQTMIQVSLVITGFTLLLGPLMIRILYGTRYSSAASVLNIHIWTGIFVSVGCIGGQQYIHEKITSVIMKRTVLGAIVNVILNLLLIPHWGGVGSAMATLVAQSLATYFGDAFSANTRHIFKMKTRAFLQFWMLPRFLFNAPQE
jgi:polysaccharide transporter, PST family